MREGTRVVAVPGTVPAAAVRDVERAVAGRAVAGPVGTAAADGYAECRRPAVTVLVVPAAVTVGADELDLIAASGAPPSAVVLVLAGPPGVPRMRDAVERQRRVLAEFAPGYEQCTVVSGAAAAGLMREAVERTRRTAAGCDAAAELAACRAAAERARGRRTGERRRAQALRAAGALQGRRDELVRRRTGLRSEDGLPARMTALRTELSRARVELGHEIAAGARQAAADARADLDGAGRAEAEAFPGRLGRRLETAGRGFARRMDERLAAAVPDAESAAAAPEADDGPRLPVAPGRGRRAVEDRLMILMGASGGLGLGRLVTAGPLAGLLGPGPWAASAWAVTLASGGLVAWWIVRARAHLARRARLKQWSAEAVAEFRAGWERRLAHRVLDAEAHAARAVGAAHARELRAVETELARVDADLASVRAEVRDGATATAEQTVDNPHAGAPPAVP